jgi:hypothetical protein
MADVNANADVMEIDEVQLHEHFAEVLQNVVGLTAQQIALLQNQGINIVTDLMMVEETILLDVFARHHQLTAMNKMKLLALRIWTTTHAQGVMAGREAYLDPRTFDANTCQQIQLRLAMKGKTDKSGEAKTTSVGKLDPFSGKLQDWDAANRKLMSYLGQQRNNAGVPLTYVIRDESERPNEFHDGMQAEIWGAPLEGPNFDIDKYLVYQVLLQWTAAGDAETHVDSFNDSSDGRAAYQTVVVNYEGEDAKQAMIAKARYSIDHAHYEGDTAGFTFHTYCTKHLAAQNDLKRRGVAMNGQSQVLKFIQGIKREQFLVIKPTIFGSPEANSNLLAATTLFKTELGKIFNYPYGQKQNQNTRKIGSMRGHGGRNYHRGGRGRFDNFGGGRGRAYGGRGFQGQRDGGRGRGGGRNYQSNNTDDGLYIAPKVLTVNNLSLLHRAMIFKGRDEMRKRDSDSQSHTDNHSIKALKSDDNEETTEKEESTKNSASEKFGNQTLGNSRKQGGLSTSMCRTIAGFHANVTNNNDYHTQYRLEIDSCADTTCCGCGFIPIAEVDQVCNVSGFHPSMPVMKDIPICTCATAYDHLNGETFILEFGQALWFGDSMEHSLMSPNQVCTFQNEVCLTPKQFLDGNSLHGIYAKSDDVTMPFQMFGCISYLPIQTPSPSELKTCRHIRLTSDELWEPYNENFTQAENIYQRSPHIGHLVYATSSKDHRSKVEPEVLAHRWGTSLDIASHTLKVTTQRGLRYLEGNLSRRFRTRQAQLRYKFLRSDVYSDTLFSDVKYICVLSYFSPVRILLKFIQ